MLRLLFLSIFITNVTANKQMCWFPVAIFSSIRIMIRTPLLLLQYYRFHMYVLSIIHLFSKVATYMSIILGIIEWQHDY